MHLYCTPVGRPRLRCTLTAPRARPAALERRRSQRGWQFSWGGGLLKSNGGVHAAPQYPAGAMRAVPGSQAYPPGWGGVSRRP
jgi:hypothetical protein